MNKLLESGLLLAAGLVLGACNTTTVKTTDEAPAAAVTPEQIPETMLLDVGVGIFDPGTDKLPEEELRTIFPEVRKAESRYMPGVLAQTLQGTGAWGVVRVIPDRQSEMDLWVDGEILQSDGEFLKLKITVQDASGRTWYTRNYEEEASKYAYDKQLRGNHEPFQGLYNRIANDMYAFMRTLKPEDVKYLRTITELQFARRFAPDVFSDYLVADKKGLYHVQRLPAEGDPLLQRIRRVRDRDALFVDTLQDYYASYGREMQEPYLQWRTESYRETQDLRRTQAQSTARLIGGVLSVLAGIGAMVASSGSDSAAVRTAGQVGGIVGVGAGAMLVKSGLEKRAEAKLQLESLREIAGSLDAEIQPHTVTLEDRTVTLSGTVNEQYSQWREILRQIYLTETGQAPQAPAASD